MISAVGFIPVLMLICHIVLLPLSPVAMAVESDPLSSDDASIAVPVLDDQVKAEQKTSTSDRPLESCEIAPGVSLVKQHRIESYGPVAVNILAVTPTPQVSLSIGLATRGSLGLEPLSAIAEREGALAAVNGTFFHWSGLPLGLLVDRGVLISAPVYERTTLVMLTDGSGGLDRVLLRIWLQLADGTRLPVHGVNRQAKSGECVIYNTAFARETPSFAPEQELVGSMCSQFTKPGDFDDRISSSLPRRREYGALLCCDPVFASHDEPCLCSPSEGAQSYPYERCSC